MCRERGSVLFSSPKTFERTVIQNEPERLILNGNHHQYAHLLLANENLVLSEIIEREQMELLRQLEEDGDQPEACFIKQALEENNVNDVFTEGIFTGFVCFRRERKLFENEWTDRN